jgi:ElaB/YqjD/DUF883 family membrane-anchored ribosome-binding protein
MSISENIGAILQQIASLSADELAELRSRIDDLSSAKSNAAADDLQDYSKDQAAFKWINEHGREYPGQWLALDGDTLLAHGLDLSQVATAARAQNVQFPLLHLVEPPRDHPYIRS